MNSNETWELIERKMLELRILTNSNWKNQEYELAVLGEKVLRTVELAKADSEAVRSRLSGQSTVPADTRKELCLS